jgi:hypothetical protein
VVAACASRQIVTFSLSADPLTGAARSYRLRSVRSSATGGVSGGSVSTRNWRDGVYLVTTTFAGTVNCAPSSSTEVLSVVGSGLFADGGGAYKVSALGTTSFGFDVKATTAGRTKAYAGHLTVVTTGKWLLVANVTTLRLASSSQARISGTGNLYVWRLSIGRLGSWTLVKTRVAYHATANATSQGSAGSFGITISYTPTHAQPPLPPYAPLAIVHGRIYIS